MDKQWTNLRLNRLLENVSHYLITDRDLSKAVIRVAFLRGIGFNSFLFRLLFIYLFVYFAIYIYVLLSYVILNKVSRWRIALNNSVILYTLATAISAVFGKQRLRLDLDYST